MRGREKRVRGMQGQRREMCCQKGPAACLPAQLFEYWHDELLSSSSAGILSSSAARRAEKDLKRRRRESGGCNCPAVTAACFIPSLQRSALPLSAGWLVVPNLPDMMMMIMMREGEKRREVSQVRRGQT